MHFRPERAFLGATVTGALAAFAVNLVARSWVVGHDWASVVASAALCAVALTFVLVFWLLASKNIDLVKPVNPIATPMIGTVFGAILFGLAAKPGAGTDGANFLLMVGLFTASGAGLRFGFVKKEK